MTGKELVLKAVFDKALRLMDQSIAEKISVDEDFLTDQRDAAELRNRYEALPLEFQHKLVIDDYHACDCSRLSRMVELAYLAGTETALRIIGEQAS